MVYTILFGCLVSVAIEVLQFFTQRGLCELDDVIHNTLGVVIGYGVYKVISKVKRYY